MNARPVWIVTWPEQSGTSAALAPSPSAKLVLLNCLTLAHRPRTATLPGRHVDRPKACGVQQTCVSLYRCPAPSPSVRVLSSQVGRRRRRRARYHNTQEPAYHVVHFVVHDVASVQTYSVVLHMCQRTVCNASIMQGLVASLTCFALLQAGAVDLSLLKKSQRSRSYHSAMYGTGQSTCLL